MLCLIIVQGKKIAYDSVSGALVPLTSLQYKMLGALVPPITKVCPTSLRYELAKFDSSDVSEAYNALYSLAEKGILFAEGDERTAVLRIDGEYSVTNAEEAEKAIEAAAENGTHSFRAIAETADTSEIVSLAAKHGLK